MELKVAILTIQIHIYISHKGIERINIFLYIYIKIIFQIPLKCSRYPGDFSRKSITYLVIVCSRTYGSYWFWIGVGAGISGVGIGWGVVGRLIWGRGIGGFYKGAISYLCEMGFYYWDCALYYYSYGIFFKSLLILWLCISLKTKTSGFLVVLMDNYVVLN